MSRSAASWHDLNERVIAEFRANGGVVRSRRWPVILLTTTGARTGRQHVTPLNFSQDGERLVVIASKGGSATHPDWYLNLLANPVVTIEHGSEEFRARARVAEEPERTRLFDRQAQVMTFFDGYRRRVRARQIPVVVFERTEESARQSSAVLAEALRHHVPMTDQPHPNAALGTEPIRTISREGLKSKLDASESFSLIMALNRWAFDSKHIPGSLHFDTPQELYAAIGPDDEVVVYCSNVDCLASVALYRDLVGRGYRNVRRYAGGLMDWEDAGLPLEGNDAPTR